MGLIIIVVRWCTIEILIEKSSDRAGRVSEASDSQATQHPGSHSLSEMGACT